MLHLKKKRDRQLYKARRIMIECALFPPRIILGSDIDIVDFKRDRLQLWPVP